MNRLCALKNDGEGVVTCDDAIRQEAFRSQRCDSQVSKLRKV